jgi:hypothetical protein
VEQSGEFFVSNPARRLYPGPPDLLRLGGDGCAEASLADWVFAADGDGAAGVTRLSDSDDNKPSGVPKGPKKRPGGNVGDALRSVYDRTLNEDIPPDLLDLLGKLD